MEHINIKPIPETTGKFTSLSHQLYRITKPVQIISPVIKREKGEKKVVGRQKVLKL